MSPHAAQCPPIAELERILDEELDEASRSAIETHIESCSSCQAELERLVAPTSPLTRPAAPSPGDRISGSDEAFLEELRHRRPGPATRPEDPLPGRIGPYEIEGRLGRGGMGAVYRARHPALDRVVALKVLPAGRLDEAAISRFQTEMKAAGRLDHPNIVTAHDAGSSGDVHYLVMELVEGLDLAQLVQRRGPLGAADACEIIRQAAAGLAHAHARGLVHRDVKPSNLMLARTGLVKVLDLGLARQRARDPKEGLTATGLFLGTADYVAPEQIDRPQAADDRSDVYGLGATFYFLLAGEAPFGGDRERSWLGKLRAHQEEPVPPLGKRRSDLPAALIALVESMLAKNPADRPQAPAIAQELKTFAAGADLRSLIESAGLVGEPVEVDPRAETVAPLETRRGVPVGSGTRERGRALLILAGLAAVMLIGLFAWRPWASPPAGPLPEPTPEPVRILALEVRQVRGPEGRPVGVIGVNRETILLDDGVRIAAKPSGPAYYYLVAFNPDGTEQLCLPEGDSEEKARATPPARVTELTFPGEGRGFFILDSAGNQAFVLAASSRPLPPYAEWRARVGSPPWNVEIARSVPPAGVWRGTPTAWTELIDDPYLRPLSKSVTALKLPSFMKERSGSGKVMKRGSDVPKQFADLAAHFRASPDFDAVEVISFPVYRAPK